MISPLTNERKFGDVSNEDFTTLGLTVVQNSSDITTANTQIAANAAKPSSSQVDSQIDVKNTTQMTQLYTKTETDAALALKGSASGLATVTAYASGLPTTTTVNNLIDSKNITQDITNFGTFAVRSDTYTKSAVDTIVSNQAATTASTYAPQSSTYTKTQVDAIETNINTTAASTYATQSALATVTASAATNATNITATQAEVVLLQSAATANSAQGQTNTTTLAGVVAGSQALASADITGNAISRRLVAGGRNHEYKQLPWCKLGGIWEHSVESSDRGGLRTATEYDWKRNVCRILVCWRRADNGRRCGCYRG